MLNRIRGTRDILDARSMQQVISLISQKLINSCFTPVHLPILEAVDLFQRSLGQGSDAVAKEMYLVRCIHGEDEAICLRPEATASMMRAYLLNRPEVKPWRVFTSGSMFRHERPQKGRYREFTQVDIEIIGGASSLYDVELLSLLTTLFQEDFKLTDYELDLNFIGSHEDRTAYKEVLLEYIHSFNTIPQGILTTAQTNLLRVFDLKDESCRQFMAHAPFISDYLSSESADDWQQIKSNLNSLGISYIHNPRLVRGLDYYNGTVFEFTSRKLGAQSSFCAGGRYDDLATILGSREKHPSVGAGIGVDRLLLMLFPEDQAQSEKTKQGHIAAVAASPEYASSLFALTLSLRSQGMKIEFYADKTSLKSALRKADADGARAVLILGEQEDAAQSVAVKSLETGEQVVVKKENLVDFFKRF